MAAEDDDLRPRARRVVRRVPSSRRSIRSRNVSDSRQERKSLSVDELRQARTTFFDQTPEERRASRYEPMVQEIRVKEEPKRRASMKGPVRSGSTRQSRNVKSSRDRSRDGEYVYRVVEEEVHSEDLSPPAEPRPTRIRGGGRSTNTLQGTVKRTRSSRESERSNARSSVDRGSRAASRSIFGRHQGSATPSRRQSVRSSTQRTRAASDQLPSITEVMPGPVSPTKKKDRPTSVFGSLFGPRRSSREEPTVECLTCMSTVSTSKTARLSCNHNMCHSCLRRIFVLSINDPAHMPPRCCTTDHIPLKHVDKIFDTKFKLKWNKKYQEYTTANRLYCPTRGCSTWIPPSHIRRSTNQPDRKLASCPRCKARVCAACNRKWHSDPVCPSEEGEAAHFAALAKDSGWQRCFNCRAMVELKEGCNHMTCRCNAEFCMLCGLKWKSCDCPWFNHPTVPLDAPPRYIAERRREQEEHDEDLARRMQGLEVGWGNMAGHFLNEHFVTRVVDTLGFGRGAEGAAANRVSREIRTERIPPLPPTAVVGPLDPPPRRTDRRSRVNVMDFRVAEPLEEHTNGQRTSLLAGLTGRGNVGRVDQWRRHIIDDASVPVV